MGFSSLLIWGSLILIVHATVCAIQRTHIRRTLKFSSPKVSLFDNNRFAQIVTGSRR